MQIDRAFTRIADGQVHYRTCGADGAVPPLYMIHASPASSVFLEPLMAVFGESRRVIAPDTLGNGDSAPIAADDPYAEDYADSVVRVLDALKLERVDVYGSHTGAHIGVELAINHPTRVRRLVLDGLAMFSEDDKTELMAHYAPEIRPDITGSQFNWAWHFIRDQMVYFPYFKRDPEHLRHVPMAPPELLHTLTVEVLKAVTTYHKGYRAAFRHDAVRRLPLIAQPTLCIAAEDDPLRTGIPEAAALIPQARQAIVPHNQLCSTILEFLDGPDTD